MNKDHMSGQKDGPTETQVVSKDTQHVILHTDGVTKSSKGRSERYHDGSSKQTLYRGEMCAPLTTSQT